MHCPHCNLLLNEVRLFCPGCGKKLPSGSIQNVTAGKELETIDQLLAHFSQVENEYAQYDKVCEQIPYYGPGSSRTPFVWAILIGGIASLISLGCCISGEFGAAAGIFGISQIPCFFLVGGGLLVYRRNRINYRECCEKYLQLSKQLQAHYRAYPDCPISPQYTNPKILQAIRARLVNGQAATIGEASQQILSHFNRDRLNSLIAGLQHYTAHLPQPDIFFLPGQYFSARASNARDLAKYFLNT